MEYLILIVGFVLLIKGADFFVDGSSSIARTLKVPSVVIGLTLVSVGTSAPEAAVSITAAFSGNSNISLGNIIGSNIFNLLVVIGCAALFRAIPIEKMILKRDLPINTLISGGLLLMMLNGKINRLEGFILLAGIIAYMVYLVISAMKNRAEESSEKTLPILLSLLYVVLGMGAVVFGGQLVVNNATIIARNLGMSDTLVALTIVALGTSLPELVTSVVAARKGDSGIALGNAVGSCIFNILLIVGASSLLNPVMVDMKLIVDIILLILVNVLLILFCKSKEEISKIEGLVLVLIYVGYTAFIIMRNYQFGPFF